jgi:hypothetical protein
MFSISRPRTASFPLSICIVLSAGALLALNGGRPAQAQQPDAAETDTTIQVETTTRKSPSRAQLYSLGGTLVPVVLGAGMNKEMDDVRVPLLAAGILVGPSAGHFYAENTTQALTGIGLRLGGVAIGFRGLLENPLGEGGEGLILVGGLTILTSGVYDIFTAGGAARDYNETHGLKAHVGPAVGPQGEQVGLSLQVQF